jgi:outer membrane protein
MSLTIARGAMTAITLAILALAATTDAQAAEPTAVVGAGVAYVPKYDGASDKRVSPVLFGEYNFGNGAFISTMRGIGYGTNIDGIELSAALGVRGARYETSRSGRSGSDALKGMGDIDATTTANLSASTRIGEFGIGMGMQFALGKREYGNTYAFHASHPLYKSGSDSVELSAGAVYGDRKHAQTYYGVTAAQSLRSGYKATKAGAGFEQVSLSAAWTHTIDKHWSVRSVVGLTSLVGDAADSPLTRKKTTPVFISTVNYAF